MSNSSVSNTIKATVALVVLALIAVAWVLATRGAGNDVSSYLPLEVGNSWSYETTQRGTVTGGPNESEGTKAGTLEQRVVGVSRLSSDELEIFELSQTAEKPGSEGVASVSVESALHVSAAPSAIAVHGVDSNDSSAEETAEPVVLLSDPPSTEPVTNESGSVRISFGVTSQGLEPVSVPAGEFPDALKKVVEGPVSGTVSGLPIRSGSMTETTWFAREVGIVKQVRVLEYTVESPEDGEIRLEESLERVLTSFSPASSN